VVGVSEDSNAEIVMSLNERVKKSIEAIFPQHIAPDRENHLPGSVQHKAPDYSVLDGKLLIELKSRHRHDDGDIYEKLLSIAAAQGKLFRAYGSINMGQIIKILPDPEQANRAIADYFMSQTLKSIRKARKQFDDYQTHKRVTECVRPLIFSDETDGWGSNDWIEHFLGRKMGGYDPKEDVTGSIDAIMFLQDPRQVWCGPNNYWFKCLIKKRLRLSEISLIRSLASALHDTILGTYENDSSVLEQMRNRFRILTV
jgi:hypothetical protein